MYPRLVDNVYMAASVESSEPVDTRARIVAAGVGLLDESGMEGLGLRAIARRAGVSHGAPRRYFPTHAALLAAIARVGLAELAQTMHPLLADTTVSPRGRLLAAALAYLDAARARRAMFELMFRHDILAGAGGDLRELSVPLIGALHQAIAAGTENAADDPGTVTRTLRLWSSVHGLAVLVANQTLAPLTAVAVIDIDDLVAAAVDAALD